MYIYIYIYIYIYKYMHISIHSGRFLLSGNSYVYTNNKVSKVFVNRNKDS